jgi:cytidylate kinase
MQRQHIITLSGKPGSGKSSTADRVAELLGYTRYSSGDMVRRFITEQGMTLSEFNQRAMNDSALDVAIDDQLRDLRSRNDIVIDARLGFYWIPESFKVYLDLSMDVATSRIYKDAVENTQRAAEASQVNSLAEAQKQVRARMNAELRRFRRIYGVDPFNPNNFDLVINTSRHSPQTVALTIFDTYKKWLNSDEWRPVYSAVPTGYSFEDS